MFQYRYNERNIIREYQIVIFEYKLLFPLKVMICLSVKVKHKRYSFVFFFLFSSFNYLISNMFPLTEENKHVAQLLLSTGTCARCIFRFCGVDVHAPYKLPYKVFSFFFKLRKGLYFKISTFIFEGKYLFIPLY